jgi:large subunit ribosomal protein L22
MEAVAKLRNCPMSARKMRMVAEIIRGKQVDEALNLLRFTKREAAGWLEKLLVSAIANWEYKQNMAANADDHDLVVKTVLVDEAGMLKRFRPAPHGRAHRIRKRSNHVTLVVENTIPLALDMVTTEEEE